MGFAGGGHDGRWAVPDAWEWRRARDFARIIGGGTPKNAADPSNFDDAGTPWLTPADLSGYHRSTIDRGRRSLSSSGLAASSARLLPKGTVLISSRAPVGYCTVAGRGVTTNQGFRSLVCDERIDPFFIRYYVLFSRSYLEDNASGTTFKELSGTALGDLLFPIPPLETQRRIVARIDELFSELDDGEEELARARADLETCRKALLKAAVTGELTAGWRASALPTESGSELLLRIVDERTAGSSTKPRARGRRIDALSGPEGDLPFELPDDWVCAAIGQVGEIVTGSTPSTTRTDFYGGDVPFYTPGDLDRDLVEATRRSLTEAGLASVRSVAEGSVMVTCIGATIGKLAMAGAAGATNQQINSVIPPSLSMGRWVQMYLASAFGQQEIIGRSSSTTMPILNKGDFSRIPMPLPPEEEIGRIVALVDALSADAEAASDDLDALDASGATLRQSILAAAFRGELVQ